MTNGEEEIREGEEASNPPAPEGRPAPEASPAPEGRPAPEASPAPEAPPAPETQPPAKKSSNTILIVLGIIAICCIGVVVLIFAGAISLGDITGPLYSNETVNGVTFKIPSDYERMSGTVDGMTEFKNGTNFIRIDGTSEKYEIYTWGLAVSTVLNGAEGTKVNLNGTTAYRFKVTDSLAGGPTDQDVYVYALNLEGKSFIIVMSRNIESPNELLINMTNKD